MIVGVTRMVEVEVELAVTVVEDDDDCGCGEPSSTGNHMTGYRGSAWVADSFTLETSSGQIEEQVRAALARDGFADAIEDARGQ